MNAICCGVSAICSCLSTVCCKCFSMSFKEKVKSTYVVFHSLCLLFSIFILYYADSVISYFGIFMDCPTNEQQKKVCLGFSSVLRMSFTLASFHLLLMLVCLIIGGRFAKSCNEGGFVLKLLFVIGLFFGLHFVSNDFFYDYLQVSRYVSILFLFFQNLMLIDLFYSWSEKWVGKLLKGQEQYSIMILISMLIILGLYIFLSVVIFQHFSGTSPIVLGCISISVTFILTVLAYLHIRPDSIPLTSLIINLYGLYLIWSGLSSNNNPDENKYLRDNQFNKVMIIEIVMNVTLALISIIYLSFQSKQNCQHFKAINEKLLDDNQEANKQQKQDVENQDLQQQQQNQQKNDKDDVSDYEDNKYTVFHFIMTILSFYACMMLTNWGTPQIGANQLDNFKPSKGSFWIKVIASFANQVLYFWTLIAPRVFPNRQF